MESLSISNGLTQIYRESHVLLIFGKTWLFKYENYDWHRGIKIPKLIFSVQKSDNRASAL